MAVRGEQDRVRVVYRVAPDLPAAERGTHCGGQDLLEVVVPRHVADVDRDRPTRGEALADDIDTVARRAQLRAGLESLAGEVAGLRGARESLTLLLSDDDLAWKAYATSLLAEALAEE